MRCNLSMCFCGPTKTRKEHDLMHGCYTLCPTWALLFSVTKAVLQIFNTTINNANIHILLKNSVYLHLSEGESGQNSVLFN